jgi:uncharacterized membrane protein
LKNSPDKKNRFDFIDQFRGLVGILMLLGHSSYYFNSIWNNLDPIDPLFASWDQFLLRYAGYLCAPGFLMMNGAMVWWAYERRIAKGTPDWTARWHLIQRGLFLVLVQVTWVNSSWGGFTEFKPLHLGIIACIGLSMIFLTLIVNTSWQIRLGVALGILILHPFLLKITYSADNNFATVIMQTFVDSGEFNKYPVLPWFALATLGSVMASGWLKSWKTVNKRIQMGLIISFTAFILAVIIRLGDGFGNIFPFSNFWSYSFFLDQKYPPSLYHSVWFFGCVVLGVTATIAIGKAIPKIFSILGIVGRVPLFFYCVHIGILGIVSKRFGLYYHEGEVAAALIGLIIMLIVMLPLAYWFSIVKQKSNNFIIKLI